MENSIIEAYNKAYDLAFEWLKNHLIYMFKENKEVYEILNCMGVIAFYGKNGGSFYGFQEERLIGYDELYEFLGEWDSKFRLTGDPIKINKNGLVTKW